MGIAIDLYTVILLAYRLLLLVVCMLRLTPAWGLVVIVKAAYQQNEQNMNV